MTSVSRLSIAPVKSMQLQHRDEVRVDRFGVPENRRFYVAKPDGRLFNNSDHGPLVRIRPDYDPDAERLTLHFPDGSRVEGDASHLGRPVRTNFFGRWAGGRVLEGPWDEALSSYAGRPLVLVRADPGAASDSAPVSMYSVASAEELDRRSGVERPLDRRRWRMLIEIDGTRPHEEDAWVGSRVAVGGAVLEVLRPVGRCVITTQDPETGIRDFDTLGAIKAYRGLVDGRKIPFGVYADVVRSGSVRVGDRVEQLPR